tara:strand:- start:324 stop:440 length:117 start_codon:yes stop_codon:yes gene_type:complete
MVFDMKLLFGIIIFAGVVWSIRVGHKHAMAQSNIVESE